MNFKINRFKSLSSTMDKAKEFSAGNIVTAEEQTKGRGRFKRVWKSGKGGVYFTIVLKSKIKNTKYYTFLAAIIVQHTLKKLYGLDARIKWPNDLIIREKKLCGILTENYIGNNVENNVENNKTKMIIGIGINVNNKVPPEGISLKVLGIKADKDEIIKELAEQFEKDYAKEFVLKEWRKLSHTLGKKVKVITKSKEIMGIAEDIDEDCNLLVNSDGKIEKILEGDVFLA